MISLTLFDRIYMFLVLGLIFALIFIFAYTEDLTLVQEQDESREEEILQGRIDLYQYRRTLAMHMEMETDEPEEEKTQVVTRHMESNGGVFDNPEIGDSDPEAEHITEVSPLNEDVAEKLLEQAEELDLEPSLLLGLIQIESFFDPKNVSSAGALGIMQLMPNTARPVAARNDLQYERDMLFDPEYNIKLGTLQLRYLLDQYDGNIHKALTAYNRGEGGLNSYITRTGTPESTFSHRVMEVAEEYEEAIEDISQ